ncbi:MAG: hypothetical protein O2960_10045 [Verrucomicrobia bacterium]|nr:hypothetical protein [Verrucomicrobiota bacterium]
MNFDFLCLAVGLAVGFAAGWLSYRGRQTVRRQIAEEARMALEQEFNRLRIDVAKSSERNSLLEETIEALQSEVGQERQFNISLHTELSRERTSHNHLEQKVEQQKSDLLKLQQRLSEEFRNLVQQVLEEKSKTLSDVNAASLTALLEPITENLQDFKRKLEDQHSRETHELIVLHNKLSNLESKHWPLSNGAQSSPALESEEPAPETSERDEAHMESGFVELTPELLKSSFFDGNSSGFETGASLSKLSEHDDFQSFSTKQNVEIDNFFKRTLGRAQKKKIAR